MSAQHTKAILSVWENPYEANSFQLRGDVHWLLSVRHNGEQIMDVQRENLRRLAACWNACQGIDTHALELMTGDLSIENQIKAGHRPAPKRKNKYREQRDELLNALKDVRDNVRSDSPDMWERVDAAIAKAEEDQE